MVGREDKKENDLFFLCSLVEYMARKTKNHPSVVVSKLGEKNVEKIYDLADVYHSDNIDDVSDDFIEKCKIDMGDFDNVRECMYAVPSHWDMGKVYKRLVLYISTSENIEVIPAFRKLFSSRLIDKIENYNSDLYYQTEDTIMDFLPADERKLFPRCFFTEMTP